MLQIATHRVSVAGCAGGTYELTWGQLAEFQLMEAVGPEAAAGGSVRRFGDLRSVRDVAEVLAGIREVVRRYDALRTTFEVDGDDNRRQVVRTAGELDVHVYAAAAADLDEAARALAESLSAPAFRPDELPIRLAIVTDGDTPRRLVMAMYHPAADGVAAAILHEEILRLGADPSAETSACWQPGQIAEYEGSEQGRRYAARAESYVRTQLTKSPPVPGLTGPTGVGPVELSWATLRSPATAAAVLTLSRRYRVSPATVLLAAYGVVAGRWLGREVVPLGLACANRQDARLERSIANVAQFSPVVLQVGAGTFAEICSRTAAASLLAYRFGRCDPRLRRQTLAELERELGAPALPAYSVNLRLDGQVAFNKDEARTGHARLKSYAGIAEGELRALVGGGVARDGIAPQSRAFRFVRFNIWELTDVADMMLMGDNTAVVPGGPPRLLAGLESFLVEAACDHDDTGVTELARRTGLAGQSEIRAVTHQCTGGRSVDGLP